MRLRTLTVLGVAAVLAAAPSARPATAQTPRPVGICQPGLGIGLTEIPASTAKDPRAQNYVVDSVKPGVTFTRRFQVCNGTTAPITVALYGGPASISGGAFVVTEGRPASEIGSWITVSPSSVRIAPGERAIAQATFAVPAGTAGGERYGVLLAELPARSGSDGVAVASRVGVRVYLDVNAAGEARSDFVVESLQASRRPDRTPVVTAQVRNTGARALDMRGSLALSKGPGGTSAGPFEATVGTTLAPGDVAPVSVLLDPATPDGPWLATLTMSSGLLQRRVSATILFPQDAGQAAPPVKAEDVPLAKDRKVLIPIAGSLILLLLLALLVAFLLARRRTREDDDEDEQIEDGTTEPSPPGSG